MAVASTAATAGTLTQQLSDQPHPIVPGALTRGDRHLVGIFLLPTGPASFWQHQLRPQFQPQRVRDVTIMQLDILPQI